MAASADPLELDRLAEELAEREGNSKSSEPINHDLPLPLPLSHENPYLTAPTFNVEEFLLSRVHTSLPDLRTELREYMATLKEELVRLINDDYEAFISLSTDLQGEGVRLERLKQPLGDIKAQILESKDELNAIQAAIQDKLQKRAVLREEKALLHLLLKISENMTRLESLLSITTEQESSEGSSSQLTYGIEETTEDKDRTSQAKHLSRVAAEYNQLLYHVNKARSEKCVFVDQIQWRIDRIQSSLSSDLDHLFSNLLSGLADGKVSELNKAKWTSDLTECLRTYDMLGLWRDAEDILRRDVVRAYVKKAIFPGALAAPPSPLVPHTPFVTSNAPSFLQSTKLPATPYTPYTAMHNRTTFAPTLGLASSSPWARSLEELDDPLAKLYIQIIRFVERDLSRIMDIAERVSLKPVSMSREKNGSAANLTSLALEPARTSEFHGFEIMANVVWAEIGNSIIEELGTVVFAAGRPNEFRKNHEMTQLFLRALEVLAPSEHAVEVMRKHPVYMNFERRWQLPVYFQLRWKEIITKLEESLSMTKLERAGAVADKDFATSQARAVWEAISACWSAEIYIPDLSHRFWRLTLQLLSRYKTWLDQALAGADESPTRTTATYPAKERRADSPVGRTSTSTPAPPNEAPSAESIAADDAALRNCSTVMADIRAMEANVVTIWREQISILLPEATNEDETIPEDALKHSLEQITSLQTGLSRRIISVLVRRCSEALLPVRSIPSQFRAMSNKKMPSEASYFIPTIFKPVKTYFGINTTEGPGSPLKDLVHPFAVEIFETVAERYGYYVTAMRKTEESLRRLKKGRKTTFSLFGGGAKDDEGRDEERIRTQMILDVEAFGREGEALGVEVGQSAAFRMLDEMVHREEGDAQA